MEKSKVLIVDDEESIRYTFSAFMSDAGYQVTTAASQGEALVLLANARFDLVYADILLGDGTGLDLLRRLRDYDSFCPVILITGAPEVATAAEAVRLGAYDYIPKPVTRDILLRVSRMALAVSRLREEKERFRLNLEAIFNSVQDGIVTVDNDLRVLALNSRASTFCGLAHGEGRLFNNFTPACEAPPCQSLLHKCLESRQLEEVDRVPCAHRGGGSPRVVTLTATPLIDAQGRHAGAVLVIRDETRLVVLERNLEERTRLHRLTGRSPRMQEIFRLIEILAEVDSTVLISGESGTGKELVAEALHFAGPRREQPLVKVNCSALPDNLLESELFGHAKGAFTGAIRDKIGRFQAAAGGTIFLDEIGDISPPLQMRLLRVLQEKEFERVGDHRPIRVDVRIVAATHQDLQDKVRRGEFREDLYYRLKVVGIDLPPLRERREDLPLLIEQFIARFNQKFQRQVRAVDEEVLQRLLAHPWPGNVRELEHAVEHAFILSRGPLLRCEHLPAEFRGVAVPALSLPPDADDGNAGRAAIEQALVTAGGNKAKAARLLGISRRTLYRKLEGLD